MLTESQVDLIACHWLRCPRIFTALQQGGLTAEHIQRYDLLPHKILWEATVSSVQYTGVPSELAVRESLLVSLGNLMGCDVADVARKAEKLIVKAWKFDESKLIPDFLISTGMIKNFLYDMVIRPVIGNLPNVGPEQQMAALTAATSAYARAQAGGLKSVAVFDPNIRDQMAYDSPPTPTGLPWIDIPCNGGIYNHALCGLIAGSSGGKTVAGVQWVSETLLRKEHVALFCYEQGVAGDVATRFFSYVTEMPRAVFEGPASTYPPEVHAKLDAIHEIAKTYLHVFDMTDPTAGQGCGGVEEIMGFARQMEEMGTPLSWIVVDWFGEMMMRNNSPAIKACQDDRKKYETALSQFNGMTKSLNTKCLLLHQIAPADFDKVSPREVLNWTNAKECKSFGLLMNYVFVFGKQDPKSRCMWLNISKARNAPQSKRIVKLDGDANRILDMNDRMILSQDRIGDDAYFSTKKEKKADTRSAKTVNTAAMTGGI